MIATSFSFGEYIFDLHELCDELPNPDISAWAHGAVESARFRDILLAQAEPLLDEETADDTLDVRGDGAAAVLKTALSALYDLESDPAQQKCDPPGERLRSSDLAERRSSALWIQVVHAAS